jgi:hypothetical protein
MLKVFPLVNLMPWPVITALPAKFKVPFLVSMYFENWLNTDPVWPLLVCGVLPLLLPCGDALELDDSPPGRPPGNFMPLRSLKPGFAFGTAGAETKL